ncbi:PAS domain-containing protein [Echinicola salinicaeni]|uniref:PAS domain-containing protein n=1 Tax=Echinicola salinicaeni TaxID=2762757 RepID=UPI001C9752CA|nr:PAS domain S-box protein [Echinicola salinicaeni]
MNYLEKELKELLQKDGSIFDFIKDSSLDGIWYWDIENPENEWMDNKFWTTLGYDPESMPHQSATWQDIIFKEDLEKVHVNFEKHCNNPDHPYDQIVRYHHKNGQTVWIRCRGMALRDQNGKAIRMLGAHTDLSELKRKEEILEQCNEAASIGHWNLNIKTLKLDLGSTAKKILQYEQDCQPQLRACLSKLEHHNDKQLIINSSRQAIESNRPFELEVSILGSNGSRHWVKIIGIPQIHEGQVLGFYGTIQDIDEQKVQSLKLTKEKEKLNNVINGTNVGTWEWNVQTGETICNERWAEMIGYTLEELSPISIKTLEGFIHPDDLKKQQKKLKKYFSGKSEFYKCEYRVRHKNGHWLWILDKGKVFTWTADGEPLYMFGTHRDINTSKQLSENQGLFIKNVPSALAMVNLDLQYTVASQKWLKSFQMEDESIHHLSLLDTFPDAKDKIKEIKEQCIKGANYSEEAFKLTKDGKVMWLKWEASPWLDNNGKIGGFIISAEDITQEKINEEKLKISELSFSRTFSNAAIGMALVSLEGFWLKVNKKLCQITGYSSEELMNLTFAEITHPDDLETDLAFCEELLAGHRENYQMEKRYFHKNGEIIHIILAVSLLRDVNNNPMYFISQIIDITELKKAQQKIQSLLNTTQEQNSRLQNFAHIVSHNLKSHSGNIDFMIDIVLDERPELKDLPTIAHLKQASKNLSETIYHLNEVAIINTSIKENLKCLSVYDSINKGIENISALAKSADVSISNTVSPSHKILGLPAYLDSIILNFLTNSIKYRSNGANDNLEISSYEQPDYIVLKFEDNGLGIDLERNKKELFGMYKTFHRHPESRGIGLFITKSQVDALGGKIEVESEVNKGTIFKVYFRKCK